MSSRSIPQTQCASAPNLADLLAMLEAGSFPERKRQEMASAIRTIARALGRPQEEIPANGRLLASRLKDVSPAAIGISTGRWNNVRSLLRNALSFIEPIPPGRNRNDLSAEWHTLYNKLGSRSDKIALSRVVHFLSAHGIRPGEVTEETFQCLSGPSRPIAFEEACADIRSDCQSVAPGGSDGRGGQGSRSRYSAAVDAGYTVGSGFPNRCTETAKHG